MTSKAQEQEERKSDKTTAAKTTGTEDALTREDAVNEQSPHSATTAIESAAQSVEETSAAFSNKAFSDVR